MGGGRLKIDFLNCRRRREAVLGDGRDVRRRARCRPLACAGLLVRQAPRRLAVRHRSRLTAPTPTVFMGWFYYGGGDALYRELTQDILKLNVVGFFSYSPCRHSRSAGSRRQINGPRRLQGHEVPHRRSRLQRHAGDGRERRSVAWRRKFCRRWKRASSTRSSSTTRRPTSASAPRTWPSSTTWAPTIRRPKPSKSSTTRPSSTRWPRSSSRSSRSPAGDLGRWGLEGLGHLLEGPRNPADQAWRAGQAHVGGRSLKRSSRRGTKSLPSHADSAQGPFIKKVLDSQKAWGKRVGFYAINNEADFKSAYEHYFGTMKV